jgi:hypothetical protein
MREGILDSGLPAKCLYPFLRKTQRNKKDKAISDVSDHRFDE